MTYCTTQSGSHRTADSLQTRDVIVTPEPAKGESNSATEGKVNSTGTVEKDDGTKEPHGVAAAVEAFAHLATSAEDTLTNELDRDTNNFKLQGLEGAADAL